MREGQASEVQVGRSPGVPAIYVLLFCDLLRELGYDDAPVVAELGLSRDAMLAPDARVSARAATRVAEYGLSVAGHEGLGYRFASALKITLHGPVGLLALTSATIGDALEAATRFIVLRAPFLEFRFRREGDEAVLTIAPRTPLGPAHDFVLESIVLGLVSMIEQLDPRALADAELHMAGAAPGYAGRLARRIPIPVRYDAPACSVRLLASAADRRPILADAQVAALAREQCESEMRRLFPPSDTVAALVRRRIAERDPGAPSLAEVAKKLHLSTRTLRRRLMEEDATFSTLVDEAMRERSIRLLRETDLPIAEVAHHAGYSDLSNFARAFRRWTGSSPKDARLARDRGSTSSEG